MKISRKIISLIMAAVMLTASAGVFAFASSDDENEIHFTLASDLHIQLYDEPLRVKNPESELYFSAEGSGNIYDQAAALTRQFLSMSAESGAEFVLIPGDLTRTGTAEEHACVASILRDFEQEYGIPVYVVPGNHDYFNSTPAEFASAYSEFGYAEALTSDDDTASYTIDLPGNYRLIAVDSNDPGEDGDGITDDLLGWIEDNAESAVSEGRTPILMMHHPLLEHLYMGKTLMKDFIVRNSDEIAELFCSLGIEYVFTGHEHGNDIASFEDGKGNRIYDILTTSLSSYPLEYRDITMASGKVEITMQRIENCDMDSLVDGYNEAQLQLLSTDYNAYAKGIFKYAIQKKILRYVSAEYLEKKLKTDEGITADVIEKLTDAVNEALTMPVYDDGSGSVSIESLAASKGVEIPASEYTSLIDLVTSLVAMHYYGDENMPASGNPECEIFVKGLNTALEYVLSECGVSGIDIIQKLAGNEGADSRKLSLWFTAVKTGKEDSYEVAAAVLDPLLEKFTVDTDTADRDVTLPGFGMKAETGSSFDTFFEKIRNFAEYIFNIISSLFRAIFVK